MPEPSAPAGNWGMSSLTGFLEGSVLNVFASSPAEKAKGAGDRKNPGGGVGAGAMQVQTSKQKPLMGLSQHSNEHCGDCGATAASSKPRRTASSASLESDLPELGRLERTKTPNTSVATSDEEPACRGNDVVEKGSDRPAGGKRVAAAVVAMESKGRPAAAAAAAQAHKPSKATARPSTAAAGTTAGGGAPTGAAATTGRWGRTGGIPSSSASTLVPGMSPAITPAAARSTAAFGPAPALNKAGSSEDSSSTDDNNDASGKSNNAGGGTEGGNANVNNIPAPLDLSAIPAPAPPLHRNGGKFGSSGSSASKPVVLQGAALESLKRLGRPGSSVSDRSKGLGSARGADMTVPLGAAIPMAVPLGAVVRPLGSNNLLSEKNQKQLRSREISKDFHTTGSFIEKSERSSGTAAARTESLASSSLSGGGLAWARSKSGVSGVSSSRGRRGRPAGFGGSIVGEAVPEDDGSSSDDNPPPPSPMLTAHLRGPQNGRNQTAAKPQPAGRGRTFKGRGVRPQTWNEEDGAAAAAAASTASPRGAGGGGPAMFGQLKAGAIPPGGETQTQQQNQMRLVARIAAPQDVSTNRDTFLNGQVSPGALSMVSCSTALSRHSRGAPGDPGFNDSAKHLDTLAGVAADMARRGGASAGTTELAPGLGRGAFEHISMSPSIPLRGNDLAGVSKAMPSKAVPAAPVGEVPSLERRTAALASGIGSSSSNNSNNARRSRAAGGKPHVLAAQGSRSGALDDSFSASPRSADVVPSLTVAHAPGKIYQPIAAVAPGGGGGGSHHHKRPSGTIARGTPAVHTNGLKQHRGDAGDAPPFRLPSSMRLTSFGSRASSILSPQKGSEADWEHQPKQQQQQKDLGEDTSELARRPTMIDMLSTFGSNSRGYSLAENSVLAGGRSRSNAGGGEEEDSQDEDHHQRRSASGTRRSKRGDRISQRRSRSSGSQVGGSRRFSSGSIVAESDVRSSRDRRRSASRSMSGGELLAAEGERANSSKTEGNSGDAARDPLEFSKMPAIGSLAAPGDSGQSKRHSSLSSASRRGRAENQELSPPRSRSLRRGAASGSGGGSSRRKPPSPSETSTPSKRRPARDGGRGGDDSSTGTGTSTGASTGAHHRRRSSGVHGAMAANKSIFAVAAATATTGTSGGGGGGGGDRRSNRSSRSSSRRSRSRSPRANDAGGGGDDKPPTDASSSSRRRRSRKDAGAVLTAPQEVDAADKPADATAVAVKTAALVEQEEEEAALRQQEGLARVDIVPRTLPVSASPVDETEGRRRWSRSSKKPSIGSSNPRSSGARKTATVKKRKVQRFLAIASLFRKKNRSYSSSSSDAGDDDDERTAVATAVGLGTNGGNSSGHPHPRGFTRSESREITNAVRRSHGGGFAGWLWRTVTRHRGRVSGGTGRRSPASSGGGGGMSPVLPTGTRSSARNGERKSGAAAAAPKASHSQPQPSTGHSLPRMSSRRPKSMSRNNGTTQGHQSSSGSVGCGSVVGGCITQFYDAPAADENDMLERSGGAIQKVPSAEEAAEARARVQQLLRTSQVHMKKHSSMRSGSFPADLSGTSSSTAAATGAAAAAGH